MPTLILAGEHGHPDAYAAAAKGLPDLTYATIPGARHGDVVDHPEFVRQVRAFLSAHAATPAH